MLSSAGVAPLPPGFHKLLSVTVTTFAVFPSWMYLMGGDVNCMLSGPSCTCDLHISCWQGGDICQAIAAEAFTLFNYALWVFRQMRMISLLSGLGLTLRSSAPVFCCHRFSWARVRLALAQEAVRVSPSLSPRFFCSC